MRPPPPLDPQAALFIDVDGTLLDIAPRPELVRVPAGLPALLERLARQRGGALALVSGRRIADIDRLVQPWRGAVAGVHGTERRRPDGTHVVTGDSPADKAAAAALDRLRPVLRRFAQSAPGVLLEDKGKTLAVHYRLAPEKAGEVHALTEDLAGREAGRLRLIAGKMVVEMQPSHTGKGGAIAAFMDEPPFRDRLAAFLGDDTTDEDGFAEVNRRGGLSIRVGPPNAATAAAYGLPSVASVLDWLGGNQPA